MSGFWRSRPLLCCCRSTSERMFQRPSQRLCGLRNPPRARDAERRRSGVALKGEAGDFVVENQERVTDCCAG